MLSSGGNHKTGKTRRMISDVHKDELVIGSIFDSVSVEKHLVYQQLLKLYRLTMTTLRLYQFEQSFNIIKHGPALSN